MATRYASNAARRKAAPKKPDRPSEADVNEALRVLRSDYYTDIRDLARDYAKRVADGEFTGRRGSEDLDEDIHQTVDGYNWVIYTHQAKIVQIVSDNADAAFEEGVAPEMGSDSVPFEVLAYHAIRADLREALEQEGVDLDDPGGDEDEDD
jgi:hypothetical protein